MAIITAIRRQFGFPPVVLDEHGCDVVPGSSCANPGSYYLAFIRPAMDLV